MNKKNIITTIGVVLVCTMLILLAHTLKNIGKMDAIEAIMTRRSVRSYTERPIEAPKLETILKAGMAAPTGGNKQPWAFVAIDDREVIKQLPGSKAILESAPQVIVICGDMSRTFEGVSSEFWIQDTSAATENMLLAAHALELGAVWIGVYPKQGAVEQVKNVLGLPSHIVPLSIIAVGYPSGETQVKDKWDASKVHYNCW